MRYRILLLLAICFTLATPASVQAGFWKKKAVVADTAVLAVAPAIPVSVIPGQATIARHPAKFAKVKALLRMLDGKKSARGSGWEGIVSLICGILGFIGLFATGWLGILCVPAIVLGILGLRKKNWGMALAGLILGGITLLLFLLFVLILAIFFGGLF
jgi:hypothetical protein